MKTDLRVVLDAIQHFLATGLPVVSVVEVFSASFDGPLSLFHPDFVIGRKDRFLPFDAGHSLKAVAAIAEDRGTGTLREPA